MRLSEPRVLPLTESEWTGDAKEQLDNLKRAGGRVLNIFKTLAHHPKLMKRWLVFGNHVLGKNSLLRAVDELHDDAMIGDATWKGLSERYDTQQLMDLVFTVGQYNLVSMALNTLGVQLDDGIDGFHR
jgi:hypothetical protein